MVQNTNYLPRYGKSWAIIIGINDYDLAPKLGYARQDAEAVSEILIQRFKFETINVKRLIDGVATKQNIISEYLELTDQISSRDDRVFFSSLAMGIRGWAIAERLDIWPLLMAIHRNYHPS